MVVAEARLVGLTMFVIVAQRQDNGREHALRGRVERGDGRRRATLAIMDEFGN